MKKLFALLLTTVFFTASKANTLQANDLAIIGWSALADNIRFVTLVDIPAGTVIKITDKGWNQSTNAFTTTATGDGVVTWTLSDDITRGSVFTLYLGGSDAATTLTNETNATDLSVDISVSTYTVADPVILTGDGIFIYQDSDANPYFITGFNNSAGTVDGAGWNTSIAATLRDSQLPNGIGSQNALTNGINAVGLPGSGSQQDNVQYTGSVSAANAATWTSRINNVANWTGDNSGTTSSTIGTTLSFTNTTLPLQIVKFSAGWENSVAILKWACKQREEGARFEVEGSADGISFSRVAVIPVSVSSANYVWRDNTNSKNNFYRLKLVENNGSFAYSSILQLQSFGGDRIYFVNGSSKSLRLQLQYSGSAELLLTDINGSVLKHEKLFLSPGSSVIALRDLDKALHGVYLVTIKYGTNTWRKKILL